jgi:hypothetical protein
MAGSVANLVERKATPCIPPVRQHSSDARRSEHSGRGGRVCRWRNGCDSSRLSDRRFVDAARRRERSRYRLAGRSAHRPWCLRLGVGTDRGAFASVPWVCDRAHARRSAHFPCQPRSCRGVASRCPDPCPGLHGRGRSWRSSRWPERPVEWRLRARWTAAVFGPRKVRTPQGTVLGNSQAGQPDGKCSRKQTANGLRTQARVKRWCKRPPVLRVTGAACKPHREQGQAGINCPLIIPGRPLERIGDNPPRWMVVACPTGHRIRLTGGLADVKKVPLPGDLLVLSPERGLLRVPKFVGSW